MQEGYIHTHWLRRHILIKWKSESGIEFGVENAQNSQ